MKLILFPIDSKSTSPHDSNNNATRTQWQELSPLSMMETITRAAKAKAKAREAHVSHPRTVSTDSDSILHTSAMSPLSSNSDSSSCLCTAMSPLDVVRADRPDDEMDLLTFLSTKDPTLQRIPHIIQNTQTSADDEVKSQKTANGRHPIVYGKVGKVTRIQGTSILLKWLKENWTNPYPDKPEISELSQITGRTTKRVETWLTNNRKRYWRPAIEASVESVKGGEIVAAQVKEESLRLYVAKLVNEDK